MIYNHDHFDQFIFVLSAEWCSKLLAIQLTLNDIDRQKTQMAAREAVRHIMSSPKNEKNYYCVDMSATRKKQTWEAFTKFLDSKDLENRIAAFVCSEISQSHSEDGVLSTFWLIIEDIFIAKSHAVNSNIRREIFDSLSSLVRQLNISGFDDYENLEASSNSKWDKHLISLFPDMPTAISDFYTISIATRSKFCEFWFRASAMLNIQEKTWLLSVLVKMFEELTSNKCMPVNWL